MRELIEGVKSQLAQLPEADRAELAHYLLQSFGTPDEPAEVDVAWEAELQLRWTQIEKGQISGLSADEALAAVRRQYRTESSNQATITASSVRGKTL